MKINVQPITANLAAVGSISTTGYTWIAQLAPILQLIATVISIVVGIYAIQFYRKRLKDNEARR